MDSKLYSDWQKIDFHIHSDFSNKTKNNDYKGSFSVDKLKQVINDNDINIFSITDHNVINVEAYKEYYENYDQDKDALLLVGVELDIQIAKKDKQSIYHSILIFNSNSSEGAEKISSILEQKYLDKGQDEKTRILDTFDIAEMFEGMDYIFIPHGGNTKSIKDAAKETDSVLDAQKMIILMCSGLEKVKEQNREFYNKKFDELKSDSFKNKNDIAYIECSDNHNLDYYPFSSKEDFDSNQFEFYYIKGHKNYETLRLAMIDFDSRIKSQTEIDQLKENKNFIESIKIKKDSSSMFDEDFQLSFSPYLNVFIGGRSSGKSLLFNIIKTKIDSIKEDSDYDFDSGHIEIKTKQDEDFTKLTSINKDSIIYINQGEIIDYFEKDNLSELATNSGKDDEYKSSKELFLTESRKIEDKINKLANVYEYSHKLSNNKKYVLYNHDIENILGDEYSLVFHKENSLQKINCKSDIDKSKENIKDVENASDNFSKDNFLDFKDVEKDVSNKFDELIKDKKKLIDKKEEKYERQKKFINSVFELIDESNSSIGESNKDKSDSINAKNSLPESIFEKFNHFNKLKNICSEIESFNFDTFEKKIEIDAEINIIHKIYNNQTICELIIDCIKDDKDESLYLKIVRVLIGDAKIKNYTNNDKSTYFVDKIKKATSNILEEIKNPKDVLLYPDGSTSKDKSPGYNSEKYLKIILENDNTDLIFIDQPEDNLGNKFISEELVDIIRTIKFKKQIFLVTHNPSIVVYGDAENIIISKNESNIIKYEQVVLEDSDRHNEICSILDGGEYIFKKRYEKYNIKELL